MTCDNNRCHKTDSYFKQIGATVTYSQNSASKLSVGEYNVTSVVVPAMLKCGTSQQPRLSPLPGRGYQVCTWFTFTAWSSLMHGGKSAPRDTKCVPEGPTKGFRHSVNETVTLPRNDASSNRNNTKAYFILSRSRSGVQRTTQYGRCASHTLKKKKTFYKTRIALKYLFVLKSAILKMGNRVLRGFQRFLMRQSDGDVSISRCTQYVLYTWCTEVEFG